MNPRQRTAFDERLAYARAALQAGRPAQAMPHLEVAHVLGQLHVVPHVVVHWLMLRAAVQQRWITGAAGQLVRIALGAVGSAIGRVPIGNTGGSDVSMFQPMPIPADLLSLLSAADLPRAPPRTAPRAPPPAAAP